MLLLIAGLPGSGKSFLAQKLATVLGAVYLNSDEVRTQQHARGKYSDDDKRAVYLRMAEEASHALKLGRDVIVDATFYRRSLREIFIRMASDFGVHVHIIQVRADETTARQRLSVDRELSEADFSVYQRIQQQFEEITEPHFAVLSTDSNIGQMIIDVLQYIGYNDTRDEGRGNQ